MYVIRKTKTKEIIQKKISNRIQLPFQQLNLLQQLNEIDNHNYTMYPLTDIKIIIKTKKENLKFNR